MADKPIEKLIEAAKTDDIEAIKKAAREYKQSIEIEAKSIDRSKEKEVEQTKPNEISQTTKEQTVEPKPEPVVSEKPVNRIERFEASANIKRDYDTQKNPFIDPSISDKVNALETSSDKADTPDKMIRVAKERGWTSIKVVGDEKFKQQAWEKAAEDGIKVTGYEPTPAEKEKVANKVMAKEFVLSPDEAAKKYPELKASLEAMKKTEALNLRDGLDKRQSEYVNNRVKEMLAADISRGAALKEKQAELSYG